MIALGVTFLVAIVLLGIYGLRVRAARLKQAEHGIARLEDALRETDAAIGRVESEIAAVTDAVKASLAPPERAKPAPKAEPPTLLRAVLRREHAAGALRYYVAALGEACQSLASPLSDWPSLRSQFLRYALERHHEELFGSYFLQCYREEWKAVSNVAPPCRLVGKVPKGVRYLTLQPAEALYYHPEWTALTCPAPSR